MTRTLRTPDVLICLGKLDDATKWLAVVAADVGPGQTRRIEWIADDIAHVRSELLRVSVGDAEVEAVPARRAA